MIWTQKLKNVIAAKEQAVIKILKSEFPIGCYDDSSLVFYLKPDGDTLMTVSGVFRHTFSFEEAAKILRKQSILRLFFQENDLPYEIIGELGIESFEQGQVIMALPDKHFDRDDTNGIYDYCIQFARIVAIIHAVETYEE